MIKSLMDFIKELSEINSDLVDAENIAEIAEDVSRGETDFLAWGYRFIRADVIYDILKEELLSELYCLGCFNTSFLAGIKDFPIDFDDIKAIQDAGDYEALGKIAARFIDEIASEYISWNGYGYHFGTYDGAERELSAAGQDWLAFRVD